MLPYTILFLVAAACSALLGFAGFAGSAAWIPKVLMVVFLIIAVLTWIAGNGNDRRPLS